MLYHAMPQGSLAFALQFCVQGLVSPLGGVHFFAASISSMEPPAEVGLRITCPIWLPHERLTDALQGVILWHSFSPLSLSSIRWSASLSLQGSPVFLTGRFFSSSEAFSRHSSRHLSAAVPQGRL